MLKTTSTSFWNHPIEKIEEALQLRKQIDLLQAKLNKLVDGTVETLTPTKTKRRKTGGRKAKTSIAPKSEPVKKAKTRKKNGMTPEARAKISAAMKARWDAKRKAAA